MQHAPHSSLRRSTGRAKEASIGSQRNSGSHWGLRVMLASARFRFDTKPCSSYLYCVAVRQIMRGWRRVIQVAWQSGPMVQEVPLGGDARAHIIVECADEGADAAAEQLLGAHRRRARTEVAHDRGWSVRACVCGAALGGVAKAARVCVACGRSIAFAQTAEGWFFSVSW